MSEKMMNDQIAECLGELPATVREDIQITSDGVVRVIKQDRPASYFGQEQALEILVKIHNRYKRDPAGGWSLK